MQEVVELRELEIAFMRFNKYSDSILKADYWTFKPKVSEFITFCNNNRVMNYILSPFVECNIYDNKTLRELIIKDNKLELPAAEGKQLGMIYHILNTFVSGEMNAIEEFMNIFGETNKNNAVVRFNNHLTRVFIMKLSTDLQKLYNQLATKRHSITVEDIGIYEKFRIKVKQSQQVSEVNQNNSVNTEFVDSDEIDYNTEFKILLQLVQDNPRIAADAKYNICKDIEDIEHEIFNKEINKINIFNIINSIGLKSNWTIGKMDEVLTHPVLSELIKIWALRQIGVTK